MISKFAAVSSTLISSSKCDTYPKQIQSCFNVSVLFFRLWFELNPVELCWCFCWDFTDTPHAVTLCHMGSGTRDTRSAAAAPLHSFPYFAHFIVVPLSSSSRRLARPLLVPAGGCTCACTPHVRAPPPGVEPPPPQNHRGCYSNRCVLWPRRSVSRSQQWKPSLSSTLSGPSRLQKKSRTSWTRSTLRRRRRGECHRLSCVPFSGVSLDDSSFWGQAGDFSN